MRSSGGEEAFKEVISDGPHNTGQAGVEAHQVFEKRKTRGQGRQLADEKGQRHWGVKTCGGGVVEATSWCMSTM